MLNFHTTPPLKPTPSPTGNNNNAAIPPVHNGLSSLLRAANGSSSVPASSAFPAPPNSAKCSVDESDVRSSSQPLPPFPASASLASALLRHSPSAHSFTSSSRSRTSTASSRDEPPSSSQQSLAALLSSPGLAFLQPHVQRLQALEAEQNKLAAELAEATQKRLAIMQTMSDATSPLTSPAFATNASDPARSLTVDTATSPVAHPLAGITSDLSPLRSSIHTHSARLRGASLERDRLRAKRLSHDDKAGQHTPRHSSIPSSASSLSNTSPTSLASASPGTPFGSPLTAAAQSQTTIPSALLSASLLELLCHAHHPLLGLQLSSHSVRFKSYGSSFTGSELVEWMLAQGWAEDRKDAARMAQLVAQEGWMAGVAGGSGGGSFEDGGAVYRWKEGWANVNGAVGTPTAASSDGAGGGRWQWHPDVLRYGIIVNSWKEGRQVMERILHDGGDESTSRAVRQLRQSLLHLSAAGNKHWKVNKQSVGYTRYHLSKALKHRKARSHTTAVDAASHTASDDGSTSPVEAAYKAQLTKTISLVNQSPAAYLADFLSARTRKRLQPLFTSACDIAQLSASSRLLYFTTAPLHGERPCDAVVYQDHFADGAESHVVYEMAVAHSHCPLLPSHLRVLPLLSVHIARPVSGRPDACELTVVTQLDGVAVDGAEVPRWMLDKWSGHPSAASLSIPQDGLGLDVLSSSLAAVASPSLQQSSSFAFSLSPSFHAVASPLPHASHAASPSDAHTNSPSPFASQPSPNPYSSPSPSSANPYSSPSSSASASPSSPSSAAISIPSLVPLAVLGRGAYSKIVQVYDRSTRRMFAMKVIRKSGLTYPSHYSHVLLEQEILSRMEHPFVCRLYYAFQSSDKLYMVMSYAAGGDMFTLLRRRQLSEADVALYAAELVLALRYIHTHGIVHRDVKPENILVDAQGHLVLVDFGLSKQKPHPSARTFSVSGTSEYLAPEMILAAGHDELVDYWQLGIVLCEMLTGKHPFYHRNLYRLQQNILHRTPQFDPTVSTEARSLLLALLTKDPLHRLGRLPPTLDHQGVMVASGDVESHPFFVKHRVNWTTVESRQGVPGFVPRLRDEKDVSHFDAQFTQQTPSDTPELSSFTERKLEQSVKGAKAAAAAAAAAGMGSGAQQTNGSGPALQGGYAFYSGYQADSGQSHYQPAAQQTAAQQPPPPAFPSYDSYYSPAAPPASTANGAGLHAQTYSPKYGGVALPPPLAFSSASPQAGPSSEAVPYRSDSPSALSQQLAVARQSSQPKPQQQRH